MRSLFLKSVVVFMVVFLMTDPAKADWRSYVWTYEYMTMKKGAAELEYYLTTKVKDFDEYDQKNTWEHLIELEYGVTDHWDIAVYNRWTATNTSSGDSFEYTGQKFRTRYRLGEKGQLPLDTVLYFEYINPDSSDASDEIEAKILLSKDFGDFNISYNQILEAEIEGDDETKHEYAAALGTCLSDNFKIAIESTGNYTEGKYYLGPTISFASEKWWMGIGVLAGLNDKADDLRARMIVGIPF